MMLLSNVLSEKIELIERVRPMSTTLLLIVLTCFLFVAWSGIKTNGFLIFLVKNFMRLNPKEKEFKEALKVSGSSNFLLFVNFLTSISICLFLIFKNFITINESILLSIITSLTYVFTQQFGYRFVAFISGEKEIIDAASTINRNTWQFAGILLLTLSFSWILKESFSIVYTYIFLGVIFLIFILRIGKGLLFIIKRRIKWYYFILYLCVFEILPALIFLKLVSMFFEL